MSFFENFCIRCIWHISDIRNVKANASIIKNGSKRTDLKSMATLNIILKVVATPALQETNYLRVLVSGKIKGELRTESLKFARA